MLYSRLVWLAQPELARPAAAPPLAVPPAAPVANKQVKKGARLRPRAFPLLHFQIAKRYSDWLALREKQVTNLCNSPRRATLEEAHWRIFASGDVDSRYARHVLALLALRAPLALSLEGREVNVSLFETCCSIPEIANGAIVRATPEKAKR